LQVLHPGPLRSAAADRRRVRDRGGAGRWPLVEHRPRVRAADRLRGPESRRGQEDPAPRRAGRDPATAAGAAPRLVSGARGPRVSATGWVALGSTVGGAAAFLFQIVGTRVLGPVAYAPISVLWTLQYLWVA